MRYYLGLNQYKYERENSRVPVFIDLHESTNGHMIISGSSGDGKSYQLERMIDEANQQEIEIDIFDAHDEYSGDNTSIARYSEATKYGYNPLELNSDIHSGGVRKKISELIDLFNRTRKLGTNQEYVLRNLLEDVYWLNGCDKDNPNSWVKKNITASEYRKIIQENRHSELNQYYPTIDDVIYYGQRKLESLYIGSNAKAVNALNRVNTLANSIAKINKRYIHNATSEEEKDMLIEKFEIEKVKAETAYQQYLSSIETGRELSDIMKYNSTEVLRSVLSRINILNASGIFHANPPNFPTTTRIHQIKSLRTDEKKMFVYLRLAAIFRRAQDMGITDSIRHIVVLEEADIYMNNDKENILNIIVKEGRKFGLVLWCISQSPTHYSDEILANAGITLFLGIASINWDTVCRRLKIEKKVLQFIKPQYVAAVKIVRAGQTVARFQNVIVNNEII
jgi:hypothetical protein